MAAQRQLIQVAKWGLGLGLGAFVADQSIFDVDGGEAVVMFDRFRGILDEPYEEGTHFKLPFTVQEPHHFDIRSRPRQISTNTGTKDLQMINISLRVLTRPELKSLPQLFKDFGRDYEHRILPSIGNEVLKAVVAQYNADELLTKRDKVSRTIADNLMGRAKEFGLHIDDVSITHLTFGPEFTAAIEAKQVAQQESERAKFVVMRAEQERKAAIIDAEGQSEAAQLITEAMHKHGTGLLEVRRIDAAEEIAGTLARSRNVCYLPGNNNMLLNLPG